MATGVNLRIHLSHKSMSLLMSDDASFCEQISWAGCSVARHVGRWGAEGCNSRTTLFGHHSSTSKAPTIKMLTTVISVVMMGRLMATATPPPATVGEKLQFLVQSAGLAGARRGGSGWPWASASIPPDSFYDCLYLYFSCTDHHPPGGPWAWSRIHESLEIYDGLSELQRPKQYLIGILSYKLNFIQIR